MVRMGDLGNIVVIGTTGSGKTTLARNIATRTERVHIDLDDHHWLPNWVSRPPEQFRARMVDVLAAVPAAQHWVVSGNYSVVQDIVWPRAQTIVALDYSAPRVFWQLLCRTFSRCISRTPVCNGNTETFDKSFLSKDSILVWFFKSHWRRRRTLQALIDNPGVNAYLRIIRLQNPEQTQKWLTTLT